MAQSKKAIFIGVSDTSGFYSRLHTGLSKIGVSSFFAQTLPNKHQYAAGQGSDNIFTLNCRKFHAQKQSSAVMARILAKVLFQINKLMLFIWSLFKYDTFIFTGMKCFWGVWELPIYRLLKKQTMMICLGTATRLPYADGTYTKGIYTGKIPELAEMVERIKKSTDKIKIIEKYVNYFLNLPAQAQLCRGSFISLGELGIPIEINQATYARQNVDRKENRPVKILHAASYIGCRGTKEFRDVIDKLKEKYNIDYLEITGVSNERVMDEIAKCDFIVDELYSDTPMATFAAEAASLGKPAVVCGYFAEQYRDYYSTAACPPSLYVMPESVEAAIEKLIIDVAFREDLGKKAYAFVAGRCSHTTIAQKIAQILSGDIPTEWFYDAKRIDYLWGYGVNKEESREWIRRIVNKYGLEALGISHNQHLVKTVNEIIKG